MSRLMPVLELVPRLWGNRSCKARFSRDVVRIVHANISKWGKVVDDWLHDCGDSWDVFSFCEHHIHAQSPLLRLQAKQHRLSRGCLLHPAAPADDISRHVSGSRAYFEASHAGVVFFGGRLWLSDQLMQLW